MQKFLIQITIWILQNSLLLPPSMDLMFAAIHVFFHLSMLLELDTAVKYCTVKLSVHASKVSLVQQNLKISKNCYTVILPTLSTFPKHLWIQIGASLDITLGSQRKIAHRTDSSHYGYIPWSDTQGFSCFSLPENSSLGVHLLWPMMKGVEGGRDWGGERGGQRVFVNVKGEMRGSYSWCQRLSAVLGSSDKHVIQSDLSKPHGGLPSQLLSSSDNYTVITG